MTGDMNTDDRSGNGRFLSAGPGSFGRNDQLIPYFFPGKRCFFQFKYGKLNVIATHVLPDVFRTLSTLCPIDLFCGYY
jgi:hypothetical protein